MRIKPDGFKKKNGYFGEIFAHVNYIINFVYKLQGENWEQLKKNKGYE